MTVGSTMAWDAALRILCERGDYILAEEYAFSSALETAGPLGIRIAAVKIDEQGLIPESMDEVLSNWDEKARGAAKPHLVYIVPSGQNPTGATQSAERRAEVYKVCQKHDIFIVEDEPYYFLQMQPYKADTPPPSTREEFLKVLLPSFLKMDVDGRVLRLESFSKVLSPGSRVGWVVGPEQIIERFARHFEVSSQNPSGFSQLCFFKLLDEEWGHAGFFDWLMHLRLQYTHRRDSLLDASEKYLPREVVSWVPPSAGMFVSIFLLIFSFVLANDLPHSNGSKCHGNGIPATLKGSHMKKLKNLFSWPPSTAVLSSPVEAGSEQIKRYRRTGCFSVRRLLQPRLTRCKRL